MTEPREKETRLTESSLVSVGLFATIVVAVAAGAGWAASISYRLSDIESHLENSTSDRWRGDHMRAWVRAANKEVEIWSRTAEQKLDLPPGTWHVFEFPDPDEIKGR